MINIQQENGFDSNEFDFEDEFDLDPSESILCEPFKIDEKLIFPLMASNDNDNDDDEIIKVFEVIKYCWNNGKPPKPEFSALSIELVTTNDDIKRAESEYSQQCPKIFHSQEETLKEVFAIGLKNDFPFISYLVDAYQRDRMLSKGQDLGAATWIKESPYMKKITSKSKKQATTIGAGIETYMKRVAPRFHWKAMNKIQDDIQQIIKYFVNAGEFVEQLIKNSQSTPFSYDVVIVVKKTVNNSTMVIPELEDDDDTSDDDDDEEQNEYKDDDDGKDYFGNIENQLKDNKCVFITKPLKNNNRGARFMMTTFKEFSKDLKENKYDKNKNKYDMSQYPRKKRFCSMIDRRGDGDDELIMFEPPDDSNTMPDKHVPDWYFNAGKTCIIPSMGYTNGKKTKDFDPQDTIRVDNAYKGRTITISFHVEDEESVRCYLFWNGCYIRIIYPNDLKKILLSIFDIQYKENKNYLQNKVDDDLKKLKVKDETFDSFYKEVYI